jgi:hypothetical protein
MVPVERRRATGCPEDLSVVMAAVESKDSLPEADRVRLEFAYDDLGRHLSC